MLEVLSDAAELAVATKSYSDRSGDTSASTVAAMFAASSNFVGVDLIMGTEYSSFLLEKDLTDIAGIAQRAELVLLIEFESIL